MESIKSCSVCFLSYDAKEHAPRVLPCGHTICSNCLQNLLNNPNFRKCPFDTLAFPNSQNSLTSFPINFLVIGLLEQKNNTLCKAHLGEKLKLICLTENKKICCECAKDGEHRGHRIKKIKELRAQGVKVKGELQETLSKIEEYEQEKEEDCGQIRKVFISSIGGRVKELKNVLAEKEFEWLQQINNLFEAEKNTDSQSIFAIKQQMEENIKDIMHACNNDDADLTLLDKETINGQIIVKMQPQLIKDKSSRLCNKALSMQKSLQEALDKSLLTISSLYLQSDEFIKEIFSFSMSQQTNQPSEEELAKKFKSVTFKSYFDIKMTSKDLRISAESNNPKAVEINCADLQGIETVEIQLKRHDTRMKEPSPNVLSYIFHALQRLISLNISVDPQGFNNTSLAWLGDLIHNQANHLKYLELNLGSCNFNHDSMQVLCDKVLGNMKNLQALSLDLNSLRIDDTDLQTLAGSIRTFQGSLKTLTLELSNNTQITEYGMNEIFLAIQNMNGLKELALDLYSIKLTDRSLRIFGESVLPYLQNLESLRFCINEGEISDKDISPVLINLPNLKGLELDLSLTGITDKTLEVFIEEVLPARFGSLESLAFVARGTLVSNEKFQKLREISESFTGKERESERERR